MVEKDNVFSGKIRQVGIADFKEFYRFCFMWLVNEDYWVVEKNYTEKIQATGKEIEIEWNASRKISDYFRFALKINWRIIGMKDVEVEKNGDKLKMNKGDFEVKVSAVLEKDYENKWEDSPFLKWLRTAYDRYLIRSRIENYENKIFDEANEFLAQAKAFLAVEGKK